MLIEKGIRRLFIGHGHAAWKWLAVAVAVVLLVWLLQAGRNRGSETGRLPVTAVGSQEGKAPSTADTRLQTGLNSATTDETSQPEGLYTPDSYVQELASLDADWAAPSVTLAVGIYQRRFGDAPQDWRDKAFKGFLDFHLKVIEHMDRVLQKQIEEFRSARKIGDISYESETIIRETNDSEEYRTAGLIARHSGEGYWNVFAREGFYLDVFGQYLSPAFREFLALDDVETHHPWALDACIVIPLPELGRRVRAWEDYLAKYPDSPFVKEARANYHWRLYALLFGIDNSPLVPVSEWYTTKRIRSELVSTLRDYVKENEGTTSAKLARRVLEAMEKHNFIMTDALRSELNQLQLQQ